MTKPEHFTLFDHEVFGVFVLPGEVVKMLFRALGLATARLYRKVTR